MPDAWGFYNWISAGHGTCEEWNRYCEECEEAQREYDAMIEMEHMDDDRW